MDADDSDILIGAIWQMLTPTQTTPATFDAVVAALKAHGIADASHEYPGVVSIVLDDGHAANFGTANGPWGGDFLNAEGDVIAHGYLVTDLSAPLATLIPSDSTDADLIARSIAAALLAWTGDRVRADLERQRPV